MADLNGLRVLVVEDSPLVATALSDMLAQVGCVVEANAPNMAAAVDAIENKEVQVAIVI